MPSLVENILFFLNPLQDLLSSLDAALIEIFWSDLTFKQQSSQIYCSAGTPVLLLSILVYSEVALECLQSGKFGNFVA